MFINADVERKYYERLARYVTAMRRGTPDRVPVRFLLQEVVGRHAGVTNQRLGCDWNAVFDATRGMAVDLGCDAAMLNAVWNNYAVAKAASWRYLAIPGVDIPTRGVLQFGEPGEDSPYLREDEYDEFADDPTRFLIAKWMPRFTTRVRMEGEPVTYDHNVALLSGALAYASYMSAFGPAASRLKYEAGVVSANSGMIKAPLDILGDKLRGYIGTAIDAVERPDKLRKACEALMPHILYNALAGADPDKNVPITIWAHRGCVPFYSPETFRTVFWPTLKPIFEEIIARGHQILFYAEGRWAHHIDALLELPEGGIIYHCDRDDPVEAARKQADHDRSGRPAGPDYQRLPEIPLPTQPDCLIE